MNKDQMDRVTVTGAAFVAALNDAGADVDVAVIKESAPRRDAIGCVIINPPVYRIEIHSKTVTRIA